MVVAGGHRRGGARLVVAVADHETQRSRGQVEADLALVRRLAGHRVDQHDGIARRRAAHRARLDRLTGCVADLQRRLGLAEPVPDPDAPGLVHARDDLRVEWLAGTEQLPDADFHPAEVGLDEHPPDRGGCAEGVHAATGKGVE